MLEARRAGGNPSKQLTIRAVAGPHSVAGLGNEFLTNEENHTRVAKALSEELGLAGAYGVLCRDTYRFFNVRTAGLDEEVV